MTCAIRPNGTNSLFTADSSKPTLRQNMARHKTKPEICQALVETDWNLPPRALTDKRHVQSLAEGITVGVLRTTALGRVGLGAQPPKPTLPRKTERRETERLRNTSESDGGGVGGLCSGRSRIQTTVGTGWIPVKRDCHTRLAVEFHRSSSWFIGRGFLVQNPAHFRQEQVPLKRLREDECSFIGDTLVSEHLVGVAAHVEDPLARP